jgi:16S rRNA (guanine527-N7)-methyltransferase
MAAESPARRLSALVRGHGLGPDAERALAVLLRLLQEDPHAPTAVREPARAVEAHVADALAALAVPELVRARTLVDLGSGAGLPGLVLAAALPGATVRLVESQQRKSAFIAAAISRMGLANATSVNVRAELWPEGLGQHDVVTARALAAQPVVMEYAAPLLSDGGHLIDWRGRRDAAEEHSAALAAAALGLGPARVLAVEAFPGAEHRHLHVFEKVRETPARFPRRAGMARKRPLGRP